MIFYSTSTINGQEDNYLIAPELQNGDIAEVAVCSTNFGNNLHIKGGAPEVGGSGGTR